MESNSGYGYIPVNKGHVPDRPASRDRLAPFTDEQSQNQSENPQNGTTQSSPDGVQRSSL